MVEERCKSSQSKPSVDSLVNLIHKVRELEAEDKIGIKICRRSLHGRKEVIEIGRNKDGSFCYHSSTQNINNAPILEVLQQLGVDAEYGSRIITEAIKIAMDQGKDAADSLYKLHDSKDIAIANLMSKVTYEPLEIIVEPKSNKKVKISKAKHISSINGQIMLHYLDSIGSLHEDMHVHEFASFIKSSEPSAVRHAIRSFAMTGNRLKDKIVQTVKDLLKISSDKDTPGANSRSDNQRMVKK